MTTLTTMPSCEQKGIDYKKMTAILLSIDTARDVQIQHPEAADLFRHGSGALDTARKMGLDVKYGGHCSEGTLKDIIYLVLRGYDGSFGGEPYEGQIDEDEYQKLAAQHSRRAGLENVAAISNEQRKNGGIAGGMTSRDRSVGIFALSPDQLRANAMAGYLVGLANLTPEQIKQRSLKSMQARGASEWPTEQENYLSDIMNLPEYQHTSGAWKGKPNTVLLMNEVNRKFYGGATVKTFNSVSCRLQLIRKKKKKKV